MKLLLVLISIMTFTVESKTKVSASGTWPYSMDASYACTYQKGDVRANDTAVLKVNGLDGILIEKVDIYLKSNKNKGAGVLSMTAGGEEFYRTEGSFKEWVGSYDNTNYHPVGWSGERNVDDLRIAVLGTENSLHIEKYEITWRSSSEAYDITLMDGAEVLRTEHKDLISLPVLEDRDNWLFVGWSEIEFGETSDIETPILTGIYKPEKDVTLWAVYRYGKSLDERVVTDLQDGIYLYADMNSGLAMCCNVVNGVAGSAAADVTNTMQWYDISFDTQGMATIQLTHVYGTEYIGFNGTSLVNEASKWQVYHNGTQTAFYTMVGEEIYMLYPGYMNQMTEEFSTSMVKVSDISLTPTALLYAQTEEETPVYTCHPEYGLDIEMVPVKERKTGREWVFPFGNYKLVIQDGVKKLKIER